MKTHQTYLKQKFPQIREVDLIRARTPDFYPPGQAPVVRYNPYAYDVWSKWCGDNNIVLGPTASCKYCYNDEVQPLIGDGVVLCSKCGYGIASLTELDSISGVCHSPSLPKKLKNKMPDLSYLEETVSVMVSKLPSKN